MNPRSTLDGYETPRSVEPLSQRKLMLNLGGCLWVLIAMWALTAGSSVSTPMSPEASAARLAIAAFGVAMAISAFTWIRKLDDRRTYLLMNVTIALASVFELILSTYSPSSLALMYVSFVTSATYCGQFLSLRELVGQMTLVTVFAVTGIFMNVDDPEAPHLTAQVVGLIPIIWAVALSVYALRQDRARAVVDVQKVAFRDALTGLENLRALKRRGQALLTSRNERINRPTAVIVIDLDGFRDANILRGETGGDELLVNIADVFQAVGDDRQLVARTGSDEFMVLVENADADTLGEIAERYRATALSAAGDGSGPAPVTDASIGTAISPGDGQDINSLIAAADREMYRMKAEHDRRPAVGAPAGPFTPPKRARSGPSRSEPSRFSWASRPLQVRFVAATWLTTIVAISVALTMPDAVVDNLGAVVTLTAFALFITVARYFTPPSSRGWLQVIDVTVALGALGVMTYLTGGTGSPAWPATVLVLVYVGWFMTFRWIIPMTLACGLTVFSPFLYQSTETISRFEETAIFGGVYVGAVIVALMTYNHFVLERASEFSRRLESVDPRAGVVNRRSFEKRLREEIDVLGYADNDALAIVMLDLGDFKAVSRRFGRMKSDKLLRDAGAILTATSRADDCVARLGGDEFAVLLPGVDADTARGLARRLVRELSTAMAASEFAEEANLVPSAGFALYGMHGRTAEELISASGVALTAAKTTGRSEERVSSFVVAL